MRCTFLMAALVSTFLCTPAAFARRGGGAVFSSPLNLPQLTVAQAQSMFTFLGSFKVPNNGTTGFAFGGGALSVSGTTMYMTSLVYEPVGSSNVNGIGSFAIPAISGSPDYTGGNGPSAGAAVLESPRTIGTMPPTTYTLTSGYTAGSTCAVFSSLPVGIAANAGWYLDFSGGATDDMLVTSVGSCNGASSVGWASGLSTTYTSALSVYEWNPGRIFTNSNAGNEEFTGTLVANGELYITGGGEYDGNCNGQLGWIAMTSPSIGPTWSIVTPSGGSAPSFVPGGYSAAQVSRYFAGPIAPVPSTWQSILGPDYEAGGPSFSVNSCAQPWGPTFQSFNASSVTNSGTPVSITSALGYYDATNEKLSGRAYSGPFPLTTTTGYYPATLTVAPAHNDTSETLSLPTSPVTLVASVATTGEMSVTSFTVGAFSNSGINYTFGGSGTATITSGSTSIDLSAITTGAIGPNETLVLTGTGIPSGTTITTTSGGAGTYTMSAAATATETSESITWEPPGIPSGAYMQPSYDYVPGATLTTGTYWEGDAPTTAISSQTMTLAPTGYPANTAWTMFFSDGSSAVGLVNGATFTPLTPIAGCASGCTTSVTMGPMGDEYHNGYDGQNGGGFIVPGTSTYIAFYDHNYGIQRPKNAENSCDPNSSESWWAPLAPDTRLYQTIGVYLFKISDLQKAIVGSQAPYVAGPYGYLPFPDEANLVPDGCVITTLGNTYANGWNYFDPTDDIWYVAQGGNPTVIDEYRVTPP